MSNETQYTSQQAHLHFAKSLNGRVWELLQATERTVEEDAEMVHAAHASLYHWLQVGTGVHHQRGVWLISHIYAVLGDAVQALAYARRCLELTKEHRVEMADFDVAYAYEGMARALALSGDLEQAEAYRQQAEAAGAAIMDDEAKAIFMGDLG